MLAVTDHTRHFRKRGYAPKECKRNIEMTPLCI